MSSRRLSFFALRREAAAWCSQLRSEHSIAPFFHDRSRQILRPIPEDSVLDFFEHGQHSRVYLGHPSKTLEQELAPDWTPGEIGLVQWDIPRIDGQRRLFLSEASALLHRDVGADPPAESPFKVFRQFKRLALSHLKNPVWGVNIMYGGHTRYRGLYYTDGVAQLAARGGELMQYGVDNVRYLLAEAEAEAESLRRTPG